MITELFSEKMIFVIRIMIHVKLRGCNIYGMVILLSEREGGNLLFWGPYRSEGSPGLQIVSAYSSDIVDDFRNKPCIKIRSELGVLVV